jgi:hypothetical protein
LIVALLNAAGFPNSNEIYKYVKLGAENVMKTEILKLILWSAPAKNGV